MPKAGNIILVPFPFTDLERVKVRPAVVLYASKKGDDVMVCFISSIISKKKYPFSLVVSEHEKDFLKTGLKQSSVVRIDKIATLDKKVILGELGMLSDSHISLIRKELRVIFGL